METKDYIDPTIIDETTFNNTIDSSTFDIITNLEINEKKIVINTDNICTWSYQQSNKHSKNSLRKASFFSSVMLACNWL